MKKKPWSINLFCLVLSIGFGSLPVSGQDPDPCYLFNWDVVTGGSSIYYEGFGECEYEIDIEGRSASIGYEIPQIFEASREHRVSFVFSAKDFNRQFLGGFRLMSLHTGNRADRVIAVELTWGNGPQGKGVYLQGTLGVEDSDSPGFHREIELLTQPYFAAGGFDAYIQVELRMVESSGEGESDGTVAMWVDGHLVGFSENQVFDWFHQRAPKMVEFGVVEVFDVRSSGVLRVIPLQPSPNNSEF